MNTTSSYNAYLGLLCFSKFYNIHFSPIFTVNHTVYTAPKLLYIINLFYISSFEQQLLHNLSGEGVTLTGMYTMMVG